MKVWTRFSGLIDLEDPVIDIWDIAESLARQVRWNGHSNVCVARHCINLAKRVPSDDLKIHAYLHDAAEAYLGDIPTPIKCELTISATGESFVNYEERLLRKIYDHFGVPYDQDKLNKIYDLEKEVLWEEVQDKDKNVEFNDPLAALTYYLGVISCLNI
jgi:hypothetical protein